jgi:helicase
VSAIPARQFVVVLDCCFACSAGAKVLNALKHVASHRYS